MGGEERQSHASVLGVAAGSGPRRQTRPLQCLVVEFRPPAPQQGGQERMALGSASWMLASSLHPGNQEAAGKEPRSILKNDKRRQGMKAAALRPGAGLSSGGSRDGTSREPAGPLGPSSLVPLVVLAVAVVKPLVL